MFSLLAGFAASARTHHGHQHGVLKKGVSRGTRNAEKSESADLSRGPALPPGIITMVLKS
jgi:hypothetical protein